MRETQEAELFWWIEIGTATGSLIDQIREPKIDFESKISFWDVSLRSKENAKVCETHAFHLDRQNHGFGARLKSSFNLNSKTG